MDTSLLVKAIHRIAMALESAPVEGCAALENVMAAQELLELAAHEFRDEEEESGVMPTDQTQS